MRGSRLGLPVQLKNNRGRQAECGQSQGERSHRRGKGRGMENEAIMDGREVEAYSAKMEGPSQPHLAFKDNEDGAIDVQAKGA